MNQLIGQLRAWQFREWLYAATFAVVVLLAVAVVLLAATCATDWVYDRYADTPLWLKLPLTFVLAFGTLGAGFLLFRAVRAPALDDLAGKAEGVYPELDHRLVTSIQLTRPGAKTAGMSAQLIDAVVDEAGEMAARKRLAALADTSKLKAAALVFVPLLLVVGFAVLLFGNLLWILVQRQLYVAADIPRDTTLTAAHRPLWPSGDAATLTVRVSGPIRDTDTGVVLVSATTEDGVTRATETYELKFAKWEVENETGLFEARLPPSSESFTFHARLGDGRTRTPGEVRFAPRPVVTDPVAYVLLPIYVDPAGKRRYERITPQGEVTAHRDCGVRVIAEISKPVVTANLLLLGRDPAGVETVLDTKPMALRTEKRTVLDPETKKRKLDEKGEPVLATVGVAEATFDIVLPPAAPKGPPRLPTGYRIEVADENGFANLTPPRRGISVTPDDPPRVTLLDELNKAPKETGPVDDFEIRGIPLRVGGKVGIGYRATSALGLLHAHLVYRVNDEADWAALPLSAVAADEAQVGRFVPELGLFENYTHDQSVEFYPIPSADPESEPSGLAAGGKYVFKVDAMTKQTPDKKGRTKLEVGDRVEFYVAVYDRKFALLTESERRRKELDPAKPPAGAAGGSGDRPAVEVVSTLRPPGVSESRIKKVVNAAEFQAWLDQRDRSKESLRRIEDLQRGVFGQRK